MPPNPPSKTHRFAMRSMSLRDMQISKSEKKNSWSPPPAKSWGRPCIFLILVYSVTLLGYGVSSIFVNENVLYCVMLCCVVLCCVVLCCVVLCCVVLYCIMRPYTDGPIGPLSYRHSSEHCPKW